MPCDIRNPYEIDFPLPGNSTDDRIILDTVQLPVKNHLFLDVSSMTYTDLVVTENESMHPDIEFTNRIFSHLN